MLIPLGRNGTDCFYEPDALNRFVKAYSLIEGELVPVSNIYSETTISKDQTYCEGAIGLNGIHNVDRKVQNILRFLTSTKPINNFFCGFLPLQNL